jgi:hypothetical protein
VASPISQESHYQACPLVIQFKFKHRVMVT